MDKITDLSSEKLNETNVVGSAFLQASLEFFSELFFRYVET